MTASGYTDLAIYRRLLRQARPYWLHIACIFVLDLLGTPLALLTPIPLKIVVDSVLGSKPLPGFLSAIVPANITISSTSTLAFAVGLLLAIALFKQLQELASSFLHTYTGKSWYWVFVHSFFAMCSGSHFRIMTPAGQLTPFIASSGMRPQSSTSRLTA